MERKGYTPLTLPKHPELLNDINNTIIGITLHHIGPTEGDENIERWNDAKMNHDVPTWEDVIDLLWRSLSALNEQRYDPVKRRAVIQQAVTGEPALSPADANAMRMIRAIHQFSQNYSCRKVCDEIINGDVLLEDARTVPRGSFMTAVLAGDIEEAIFRTDDMNYTAFVKAGINGTKDS